MSPNAPTSQATNGGNRERCWTIEVCRTCHRLARWPFCEHREGNGSWYRLATVKEVGQ